LFGLIVYQVATTIGAIVSLLACAGDQRVSSKDAWTKFENNTGWSNSECVVVKRVAGPDCVQMSGLSFSLLHRQCGH
jgi:hypothetical protein